MKLFKLVVCGLVVIVSAIAICLGLNILFDHFHCGEGVGTSVASWLTICCVAGFVAYLFYPKQIGVLFQRYLSNKLDEQFGTASQDSQERMAKVINQRADFECEQISRRETENVRVRRKKTNTNLQCLDEGLESYDDLVSAVKDKGMGRLYLARVKTLCEDGKKSLKDRMGFRALREIIYEIADGMFVTTDDFGERIKNAKEILRYCDGNPSSDWPSEELESLASGALVCVIFESHRNNHSEIMLEAYDVLSSRRSYLGTLAKEKLSYMYQLLGVVWSARDLNRSLSYLNLAVECDPRNSVASYFLAHLSFHDKRDYAQALEYANQSFASLEENAQEELVRGVMTIQYFCYTLKGDYFKAREIIANVDKDFALPWVVGNKAYLDFKCGYYKSAETLATKALKMNPEEGSALNAMGMLMLHRGEWLCAVKNFKAALKTLKKGRAGSEDRYFYGEVCNNCAVAYFESHDEESAKEWFEKAIDSGYARVDMRLYDLLPKGAIQQGE